MVILALDLSLNETGFYRSDEKYTNTIRPQLSNREQKIEFIKNQIATILLHINTKDIIVFIEGYSYGSRNTKWTFSAGELGGVIKNYLLNNNIHFFVVAPTMWKKFVCAKGNLKKEQILLQVYKKYGIEFKNNNECDAFCIGKFGEAYFEYRAGNLEIFNKAQLECLRKFDKGEIIDD